MVDVEVEYDGKWFAHVAGRFIQASTVRGLLAKLGPGHRIVGYYPDGFPPLPIATRPRVVSQRTLDTVASMVDGRVPLPLLKPAAEWVEPEPDLKEPAARAKSTFWTAARVGYALALKAEGKKPGEIAQILGTSRASVIGKLHRSKLEKEDAGDA